MRGKAKKQTKKNKNKKKLLTAVTQITDNL